MTVKELIEMLKTCNKESEVIIKDYDDTTYSIDDIFYYSNNYNEVVIFIE